MAKKKTLKTVKEDTKRSSRHSSRKNAIKALEITSDLSESSSDENTLIKPIADTSKLYDANAIHSSDTLLDKKDKSREPHFVNRFSFWWLCSRWPLLIIIGTSILIDLFLYYVVRQAVVFYEWFFFWTGRRAILRNMLMQSTHYAEWSNAAIQMDKEVEKDHTHLQDNSSPYYDEALISKLIRRLRKKRTAIETVSLKEKSKDLSRDTSNGVRGDDSVMDDVDVRGMMDAYTRLLLHCVQKNIGGIETESLYAHSYLHSKHCVEGYVREIVAGLEVIEKSPVLSQEEKAVVFERCGVVYGRTALCLSGVGVVKALMDTGCMPTIVTGTSAGSFIAAIICCRTDKEIYDEVFHVGFSERFTACDLSLQERWKNWKQTGSMFDNEVWYKKTVSILGGPLTFLEAYTRTGKILNISVVPDAYYATSAKMLNYITTPDIIIASAVIASSSVPGILTPQTLLQKDANGKISAFRGAGKKWRDGSLNSDIPERELHQLFDVNYTVVSQVNPHIILFFYEREGSAGAPTAHRRGGFIGSALTQHFKLDLGRWMLLLKDLDLLPKVGGSNVSDVFLQKFTGSVTIVPHARAGDYLRVLSDPNETEYARYLLQGQRRTWPKINMIRNRLAIENKLCALINA